MDFNPAEDLPGFASVAAGDIAHQLTRPAEEYINDLLCSTNPKHLKLSSVDDAIAAEVSSAFPNLSLDPVVEDELKSASSKENWRQFMSKFERQVDDFNFGTLLRISCSERYDSENTILVPRLQFLAIEILRNRRGLNDGLRDKFRMVDDF